MNRPNILVSHLGYPCDGKKTLVVPATDSKVFEIQNMSLHRTDAVGLDHEDWKAVFTGALKPHNSLMGDYLVGDFSELSRPGVYRAVLPGDRGNSYQFAISDGAAGTLPRILLDYVHNQRCGPFENEWRGPCHLDDGVRSDNGKPVDVVGGWHDAGDVRKWMHHATLPALGLMDIHERLGWAWNYWHESPWTDDLLAELAWGVNFILKMRDPDTGMIYEDVGGGGETRRLAGVNWWYDNGAGGYADNEDNRFTDNIPGSGDERVVRVQYNPLAQYMNTTILLRAARVFARQDPELAGRCLDAAQHCWNFIAGLLSDDFHTWTSVRAWRLMTATYLHKQGLVADGVVSDAFQRLIELQDSDRGFWYMDTSRHEVYRGALESAQPIIALETFIESYSEHPLAAQAIEALRRSWDGYIEPMLATNPFGIMPYAMYLQPITEGERYHPFGANACFRFFMPANHPQRYNGGLSGHWMSWAHALALGARILGRKDWQDAAWAQIHWQLGFNPLNMSYISGLGYRNPMSHSRFFGTIIGGFCLGARGDAQDRIYTDQEGRGDWSTCEYWMTPVGNILMALACLLPRKVPSDRKLGAPACRCAGRF